MADDQDIENILLDEEEDTAVDLSMGVQEPVYNQDILQASQIMDFFTVLKSVMNQTNMADAAKTQTSQFRHKTNIIDPAKGTNMADPDKGTNMADSANGTNMADPANENIDENFQTVEKEDSSTDMLTCLSQEYECSEQQGLPIDDRVQSFLQKLIWGVHKQEKLDLVLQNTLIPSNIEGLCVTKINPEIWGKICHDKKSFDLKPQSMQSWLLKTMNILTVSTNTLYKGRNLDQVAIQTLVKDTIRNCADMMMLLEK